MYGKTVLYTSKKYVSANVKFLKLAKYLTFAVVVIVIIVFTWFVYYVLEYDYNKYSK